MRRSEFFREFSTSSKSPTTIFSQSKASKTSLFVGITIVLMFAPASIIVVAILNAWSASKAITTFVPPKAK